MPIAWRRAITFSARWARMAPNCTRPRDARRDQSYFLFSTTPEQLSYLRLSAWPPAQQGRNPRPCGGIRSGRRRTSPTAKISASCPMVTMPRSSRNCAPARRKPGEIVDHEGNVRGTHNGVIHYTIGQRRGHRHWRFSANRSTWVKLDVDTKQVIVGPKSMLATRKIPVREINWLGDDPFESRAEWHLSVKGPLDPPPARGNHPPHRANHRRGRTPHPRGRRLSRSGLRVLRQ